MDPKKDSGQARMTDEKDSPDELSVNEGVDEGEIEPREQSPESESEESETETEDQVNESGETSGSSLAEEPEEEDRPAEHTLEDLAEEDSMNEPLPTGVNPQRPKSFMMEESNSQIPSSGIYSNDRSLRRPGGNRGKTLALLVIVLLVIGGAVYLLKGHKLTSEPSPSPSEEPMVSESPSPSPSPIDRSKFSVRVLNGTSTSGLAASEAAKLKNLGYSIDKTGNATNSAFTQTVIRAKASDIALGLIDQLIKDLSPDYQAASSSSDLKGSDSADAEIILGQ